MPPRKRSGLVIGGVAVAVLAIGGGVVALSMSGRAQDPTPAHAGSQTPAAGSAAPQPVVVAPVDAQTVATPVPVVVDAGVPDAAVATVAVDAGVAATVQTKVVEKKHDKHGSPKGGGHTQRGSNASSTSSGVVDRGD